MLLLLHYFHFFFFFQDEHDFSVDGPSRKLTSGGPGISRVPEIREAISSAGVVSSLKGLVLHRYRTSSWNDLDSNPVPNGVSEGGLSLDPGSDDELNASIGELTVQGSACDRNGCGLEDDVNGMLSMDSGVHSG